MQFSDKFHNIHWKNLITAVAIPLAAGGLSAWITKDGMKAFETVNQPPLTPPMLISARSAFSSGNDSKTETERMLKPRTPDN